MRLDAGQKLSHYEIVEPVGKGGMGEVYRARDTKLGRDVAIKVLPVEVSKDRERLDRFEREARLLAQLNHANVATLHGLEESEGTRFLVMELVEGETLAKRIARHPIPVGEAIPLFIQLAKGLEAAHGKGIVHRDLKPANIKITPDGTIKILDFGLAKAFASDVRESGRSESPTVTKGTAVGVILGTAAYMSPEQARGEPLDERTDIWSFGCCLFEALSGKVAFLGRTVSDTIAAILDRQPDWGALPKGLPAHLRRLLERSLAKDASRRLHHIADTRLELEDATDSESRTEAVAVRPRRVVTAVVLSALAAGGLVALVAALLTSSNLGNDSLVTRSVIPLPFRQSLWVANAASLAVSSSGRHVAFFLDRDGVPVLHVRSLEQMDSSVVSGTEGGRNCFFSPDGRWVGFTRAGKLMRVSVTGGAPVTVGDVPGQHRGASWGENGDVLLGSHLATGGLWKVSDASGDSRSFAFPNRELREKSFRLPSVLPGGQAALFTLGTADTETWDDALIALLSFETRKLEIIVEGGTTPRYSPSGHIVYGRGGNLFAVAFDATTHQVKSAPVQVVDGVYTDASEGFVLFDISANGTLVYVPGGLRGANRRVVSVDRAGRSQTLIEQTERWRDPRVSPKGDRLVLTIDSATSTVWVYDLERGSLNRLAHGWGNQLPQWSPDGRHITFSSDRGGFWNAHVTLSDGSGEVENLLPKGHTSGPLNWHPDGTRLIGVETGVETGRDIYVFELEDSQFTPFLVTEFRERHSEFSPDGRFVAYVSDESGRDEVYLRPYPAAPGKWQVSTRGGRTPRWNPVGGELFYREANKVMAVDVAVREDQVTLGQAEMIFERLIPAVSLGHDYDVFPDGERFVVLEEAVPEPPPTEIVLVQNFSAELERLVPTGN